MSLTLTDLITAGPSGKVSASAPSGTELTVTGAPGYIGPGAVVAEFTNGKTLDDPEGIKAFVAIPVQVGPETPVLRCPTDVIPVTRGGKEVSRDITSLCSVWSPTKDMADKLTFEGAWQTPVDGVSIKNGRALVIDASVTQPLDRRASSRSRRLAPRRSRRCSTLSLSRHHRRPCRRSPCRR
ncbi:MAG: hypothetical protein IPM00_09760 [Tetrasphaera sp.]|nr:hypothetical protein [Tetrasphaera sp.]